MPTFLGPFNFDEVLEKSLMSNVVLSEVKIESTLAPGSFNLGEILQVGTLIFQVILSVKTPFDGNPSLTVGDTLTQNRFLDSSQISFSEQGSYFSIPLETIEAVNQCKVYWNPGGSSTGSAKLYLISSNP